MTHVLLAVDTDESRARRHAEHVASLDWEPDAIEATVLHVFTDNVEGASINQFTPARRAREALEDAGVPTELAESSGDPSATILEYAREIDADLVSVGGRNRSPAGKAVFGSVSQSVMLGADRPVLFDGTLDE